jgi:4-amino-4-deoxy-L-arabinose transferase-like glycosyltransferase
VTRPMRIVKVMSIFAIAARFILIDQPYIDNWSWRQSDVAAIARNYFQGGFDFARPQIDWAGGEPGYVGTEFPILPFTAALCYKVFGIHEWVGRIQALILFALSLPFFFSLARKIFGDLAAVWALFFYSFAPLGIMASRCFMPDTPSLALSIIGLYFFDRWLEDERRGPFVASAICISLSILIKATSAVIAAPIVAALYERRKFSVTSGRRPLVQLLAFIAIALVPSAIWYAHAYQISLQFYPHHFFGAGGLRIMSPTWYLKVARLFVTSSLTPLLFVLGALGVFTTKSQSSARVFRWWLAAMVLFIVVVGYGNRHQWYPLPLVPIFAGFAGATCSFFANKVATRFLKIALSFAIAIVFLTWSGLYIHGFYQATAAPLRNAGLELKQITPSTSLVAAVDNGDPTVFYYAERKGWHFLEKNAIFYGDPQDSSPAIVDLEELRKRGATYLVFTSDTAWWLDYYPEFRQHVRATAALVETASQFKIYKLNPK